MCTSESEVIRRVIKRIEKQLVAGRRSEQIGLSDLVEILHMLAAEFDLANEVVAGNELI